MESKNFAFALAMGVLLVVGLIVGGIGQHRSSELSTGAAYENGRRAALFVRSDQINPYREGSKESLAFFEGWLEGKERLLEKGGE